jgi:phosphopantothenate synthetase
MTYRPKFVEMKKMFHGKSMVVIEVQPIVKTQTITIDVNVVDVNVTTRSKITEKQVFKDRKPRKAKSTTKWEKKKRLKKSMVEIIE